MLEFIRIALIVVLLGCVIYGISDMIIMKNEDEENEENRRNNMENIVEIYWHDLPEEKRRELLDAGFDNQNIVDGVFPLTHIFIDLEDKENEK